MLVALAVLGRHQTVHHAKMFRTMSIINMMELINVAYPAQQLDIGEMRALIYVGHAMNHVYNAPVT